jgi:hypothetical protein
MREVEALCAELNRLTNRPSRAYEPSDEPYPPANIGYIYVRNLGAQDGHRCSIGEVFNHGGGLLQLHGLSYLPIRDLLRVLKAKMADPEWLASMPFEQPKSTDDDA